MTTILVVDDSEVDRRLVSGLLRKDPEWVVELASDGREALQRIADNPPDLVITDLHMGEVDGLDLISTVRRDHPLVPVILMTARGNEEVALKALQAGAASYSPKVELSTDLLDNVRSVLAVARRQRGQKRLMRYMKESSFAFELENDAGLIAPLVGLVQEKMMEAELGDEADRLRLGIALEEALTNAMYHGNLELDSELRENDDRVYYDLARQRCQQPPYCHRRIYIETRHSGDTMCIVIRDEGMGFDPTSLPDPTDPENLERASGRGMLLIKTFMDEVRHNAKGNEITMIKRRGHAEDSGG